MSETVTSFGKKGITFFVNIKKENKRCGRLLITMLLKSRNGSSQKKIRLKKSDFEEIQKKDDVNEKIHFAKSLFLNELKK